MAQIITVCSQSGGVGKTTVVANLCATLALHHNKRVCAIDLDTKAEVAPVLGVTPPDNRPQLAEMIVNRKLGECIYESPTIENLWVVPADFSVSDLKIAAVPSKERLLERALPQIMQFFDVIVIDTPAGLGVWSWNAVFVSDLVLVPVRADQNEAAKTPMLNTLEWLGSFVEDERPEIHFESFYKLVLTIVDHNNRTLARKLRAYLHETFPKQTVKAEVRKRGALNHSRDVQMTIFEFAPHLKRKLERKSAEEAANDLKTLGEEILHEQQGRGTRTDQAAEVANG